MADQIDERSNKEPFLSILNSFPVINPGGYGEICAGRRLIYASLGTLYNNNPQHYEKLIDAFKAIGSKDFCDFTFVVSTGDIVFDYFATKRRLLMPENIVLVRSAPQIDILKRASLFVTHSGQNSTSEAVHYAVPMLCLPIAFDQPLVAYRIAQELGLGIVLDIEKATHLDITKAMRTIIDDNSYRERAIKYSNYSWQSPGHINGVKLIMQTLI